MKLKKIASLALAGVMAVSVLAGCANKDNSSSNGTTAPTTTSVVNAVNNGQDASNDVKVTFTDSANLDSALEKAVALKSSDIMNGTITANALEQAVSNLSGLKDAPVNSNWAAGFKTTDNLLTDDGKYDSSNVAIIKAAVEKDDTYTVVKVGQVGALNADAAAKIVAAEVNTMVSELGTSTYDVQKKSYNLKDGDNYFDFSYDGNVSMTSYTAANGATVYFYAVVLNQTVTVKTLGK